MLVVRTVSVGLTSVLPRETALERCLEPWLVGTVGTVGLDCRIVGHCRTLSDCRLSELSEPVGTCRNLSEPVGTCRTTGCMTTRDMLSDAVGHCLALSPGLEQLDAILDAMLDA